MATNLGDLATITAITAVPGSGKSLRLCQLIEEAIGRKELVYCTNVPGLKLPHIKWDDPRKWQELPEGALLVVDEAQDFFPTRRSGDDPPYIREMSRMRHYGIRLVVATQRPEYLDVYLRRLVGVHEHLCRQQGKQSAVIYRGDNRVLNVDSLKALKAPDVDSEVWPYPQHLFGMYESAPVHTVKRVARAKTKRGMLALGIAALVVAGIGYGIYSQATDNEGQEVADAVRGSDRVPRSDLLPVKSSSAAPSFATAADYLLHQTPRVPALLYSAPIFDGRKAVSDPTLYCMASGAGEDAQGDWRPAGCTCKTEQGTRVELEPVQCRHIAQNGAPYNPFKQPPPDQQRKPDASPARQASATRVASVSQNVGTAIEAGDGIGNGRVTASTAQSWAGN